LNGAKRWFRQTKYTSFQRQLNLYKFTRITNGPDKNGYYHPYFLRDREDLIRHIPRLPKNGDGVRRSDTKESEPHFYNMPPTTHDKVVIRPNNNNNNNNSSNDDDNNDAGHNLHLASAVTQEPPLPSTTSNQVRQAFRSDDLLSSQTDRVVPNNAYVNLDIASRLLRATAHPFQSSRINALTPSAIGYLDRLSGYQPAASTTAVAHLMASTATSNLDGLLSSSTLNLPSAALNPMIQPSYHCHPLRTNVSSYPSMEDWSMANPILSQRQRLMPASHPMLLPFHSSPAVPSVDWMSMLRNTTPQLPHASGGTHTTAVDSIASPDRSTTAVLECWLAQQQQQQQRACITSLHQMEQQRAMLRR
jgi:hypothetical protein